MDIINLQILKTEFQNILDGINEDIRKGENSLKDFLKEFPLNDLHNMTIDKYVIGKEKSFCYWIEQELDKLGRIKGGSPADKKFGVYYGKTKNDTTKKYRFITKWGSSYEQAFKKIKNEVIQLLEAGKHQDYEKIENSKISPLFKGKLLSIYFPDKYLNIFSIDHIDHYIESLGINYRYKNSTIESKKKVLLNYKTEDEYFRNLTNYQFTAFLYSKLNPPSLKSKNKSVNKTEIIFHPINKVKPVVIDLKIEQFSEATENKNSNYNSSFTLEYEKRIKRIGNRGELIVLNWEIEYLRINGKENLAKKVKDISKENLGYDILSFDLSGNEKHIEVKSTTSVPPEIKFFLTKNEYNMAKENLNYFIYIVFEINTREPKIFKFNPFTMDSSYYHMEPLLYHIKVNSKKQRTTASIR